MMFPNLDAEQARNKETNEEVARLLGLSRASYENKKKSGKFTVDQIKTLCTHYSCEFEYLFGDKPIRDSA